MPKEVSISVRNVLRHVFRTIVLKDHPLRYVEVESYFSQAMGIFFEIHSHQDIAEIGLVEAVKALDTSCRSTDRKKSNGGSTQPLIGQKIDLRTLHDFQKLVFVVCREFERFQEQHLTGIRCHPPLWMDTYLEQLLKEQAKDLNPQKILVRYIALLVESSFQDEGEYQAMLGISWLLYDYKPGDLTKLYKYVNGWKRLGTTSSFFSKKKLRLMEKLEGRFGHLIRQVDRQATQKARFEVKKHQNSDDFKLITETLKLFSHWGLEDVFQNSIDPKQDELKIHLDREIRQALQMSDFGRAFVWLHPDIFGRMTRFAKVPSPEQQLAVPHFHMPGEDIPNSKDEPPASTGGSTVPTPTSSSPQSGPPSPQNGVLVSQPFEMVVDVPKLFQTLDAERERRRQFRGTVLKLVVDGIEIGHIQETEKFIGELPGGPQTRTIQLYAHDMEGDFPLATVVLDPSDKRQTFSRTVENGWTATISIRPVSDETLALEIEYALATASEPVGRWAWGTSLKVGTAVLAIVVLVLTYFWLWKPRGEEDRVRQLPPPPPAPTQPQPGPTVPETPLKTPESPKQAHHPKTPDIPKPKPVVPPAPKIRYAVPSDGELARTYNQSFLDEIAQADFPVAAHQGEGVFSCSKELLLNSGSGDSESFIIKLTAPDGRLIYSKAETITKENVDQAARATARKFLEQLKK